MTRTWEEQVERDLSLVLDNDEQFMKHVLPILIRRSSSMTDLAIRLREYYEEETTDLLDLLPKQAIGYQILSEFAHGIPQSVFDSLASSYWNDLAEVQDA